MKEKVQKLAQISKLLENRIDWDIADQQ